MSAVDESRKLAVRRFRTRLLRWYSAEKRGLAWRATTDPYRILLSEVMLQQTQVSRVEEYYRRFLRRFPTLRSLARARWSSVLPLWRGLGYYQRGRNLLRTAQIVMANHDGKLPETEAELRALPGIGPYTANAILSFAFRRPVPAIDTNVTRVLSRVFHSTAAVPPLAASLFDGAARRDDGPELNHALMDLGATVCTSRKPRCEICPVSTACAFFLKGLTIPKPKRGTPKRKAVDVGAACIRSDDRYLVAKRSKQKGGAWEFPGGKREPGEDIRHCLKREIHEELGVEVSVRPAFHIEEVVVNGVRYRIHFCRCQILRGRPSAKEHSSLRWVSADELAGLGLAASNRRAATRLGAPKPGSKTGV